MMSHNPKSRAGASDELPAPKGRQTPRNLGPVSMKWLEAVGVRTLEDIEEMGVVEVYLRVEDAGFLPSRNLLWSLQGAVLDLSYAEIPPEMKEQLEAEIAELRERGRTLYRPEVPELPPGV